MQLLSKITEKLGDSGLLFVATLIVNIGNYGLNVALARWLGPEGFSEANILATIVMLLSFIAMGLQLVVTKFTAEYHALDDSLRLESIISFIKRKSITISVLVSLVLIISSSLICKFFHFSTVWPFVILFSGIPFYLLLSISRGFYQGQSKFRSLAQTYMIEMVIRLIVTIGLLAFFISKGLDSEIIAVGFFLSFVVSYFWNKIESNDLDIIPLSTKNKIIKVFSIICLYELSQILINNSDVVLVKHFFDSHEAGLYASIALLGRAVFFATWIIVTILFPKVIEKEKKGEPHSHLFWNALSIVFAIGISIVLGCYFLGDWIIAIAFGQDYNSVSELLWIYALSTTLFAIANVFVYYFMSLEKYLPVYISILAGAIQILSITLFHGHLEMVIRVQIIIMALLLSSLIIYYKVQSNQKLEQPIKIKYQNQSKL